MAGAAGVTAGPVHILRDIFQVDGVFRIAGAARRLAVGTGTVMAYQAVDIFFNGEIVVLVFPAVAYVAGRAIGKIGLRCDTEVVQDIPLAQTLLVVGIQELPGPVTGFVYLLGGFGMAMQTGLCDLGAGIELLLKFLEFGVIGGRYGICRSGKNYEDQYQLQYSERNARHSLNA